MSDQPTRAVQDYRDAAARKSDLERTELAKKKKLDMEAVEVPGDHMTAVDPAMRQCIEFFKKH